MAAPPSLHGYVWSTNRGSRGKHFDLWTASGQFSRVDVRLPRRTGSRAPSPPSRRPATSSVPHTWSRSVRWSRTTPGARRWSSPATGRAARAGSICTGTGPSTGQLGAIAEYNTEANEAYWTRTYRREYFASDRDGKGYDIYEVHEGQVRRVDVLCSEADETALFGTHGAEGVPVLLFASNRAGGRGGWDLLLRGCFATAGGSSPVNLGSRFNTEHQRVPAGGDRRRVHLLVGPARREGGATTSTAPAPRGSSSA